MKKQMADATGLLLFRGETPPSSYEQAGWKLLRSRLRAEGEVSQSSFKNRIIQKLPRYDFERLKPQFERVDIEAGQVLVQSGEQIRSVYFFESGQAFVVAKVPQSGAIEVGMIGREGMTDFAIAGHSRFETVAQTPGEAIRVPHNVFVEAVQKSACLAALMFLYQQTFIAQISFTALSHGSFTVRKRLARFILMVDDRSDERDLPFVQEFFSAMLSVRRVSVTRAINRLSSEGGIANRRGKIRVLDRDLLIKLAGGSYGHAEAEYERIFAPPLESRALVANSQQAFVEHPC